MHKFFTLLLIISFFHPQKKLLAQEGLVFDIYDGFSSTIGKSGNSDSDVYRSDKDKNSGDVTIQNSATLNVITTNTKVNDAHFEDIYSIIEGDLYINNSSLILDQYSVLIIRGNVIFSNSGSITINGGGSESGEAPSLIILGNVTGSGTITGTNKARLPYVNGTVSDVSVNVNDVTGNAAIENDITEYEDKPDLTTILTNELGPNYVTDLPVELISFEATVNPNNTTLTWSTASEQNASHFDVMRSNDKRNWEVLATIEAAGNSNVKRDYKFVDNDLLTAVTYYKLVQVDFDEAYEEFGPLTVFPNGVEKTLTANVFPNPSTESSKIQIDGLSLGNSIELSVIDKSGRMIYQDTIKDSPESLLYNLETRTTLYPGNYLIIIQSGNEKVVKRYIQQ
ncbi:T9SS type A sorting domain-containing protein [Flammeovirga pectinis]|uniref:T9SS type A sorting domain-containing protein n=1 Tax=Flammeovirga pectinis TaxID=2494373 RepID=A0A3Q9FL13_9BACT|nr:T9SS type A sorting domain-containing protein [Flammeovirga pectinis]AZQ60986.1 T9SS type A sorting domain-containing protein [Flammeovirga pectinis]